ncbi:hypothetical protein [Chitinophaga sp. sic0106]|uniref:hypothetical protein n=1 Tax=Chitinophaga sp. sic0106 TaxID=2854785 RepID=UPI001C491836|nr:hypothetical protein [Chitinophaga sp. sic0106]MBV7530917.1 hypothetical protein [Chitinophaga sp. sic0106]
MRLPKQTYQFIRRLSAILSMLLFTWVTVSMPDILIKQAEQKKSYTINADHSDSDAYSDLNEERNGLNEERVEEDTPFSEYLVDRKDPVTIILTAVQHIMGEDTFYLEHHSLELITPPPERLLFLA